MREQLSDQELIRGIIKGDTSLLHQLMDRHKQYAYTIAYRVIGNREEAEEITQDAFVKAYKAFSKFKGDAKFTTWFFRIVFNTAISYKRKVKVRTDEIDEASNHVAYDDRQIEIDEKRKYIHLAFKHMGEDDVLILTLYYFRELNTDEIEKITGFDKNNLKVKLFRARKRLGIELQKILKKEVKSLI